MRTRAIRERQLEPACARRLQKRQTTTLLAGISRKPSDGLEPSIPSLPSSDEAGTAGKAGTPRARTPRKKKDHPKTSERARPRVPSYSAWSELIPVPARPIELPIGVAPGDRITAQISARGATVTLDAPQRDDRRGLLDGDDSRSSRPVPSGVDRGNAVLLSLPLHNTAAGELRHRNVHRARRRVSLRTPGRSTTPLGSTGRSS
jgi:hypothetical protein